MAQFICRYCKADEVRWISHLDLKRTLERAMRRARLPLALTQGHNPHPKISLGPPLPVGATGDAELLTLHLTEAVAPADLKDRLNQQLPPGLRIAEAWALPAHTKKETFGGIDVAEYRVTISGDLAGVDLRRRVGELLDRQELIVHRGGQRPERTVDLRPLILSLEVRDCRPEQVELHMRLRTGSHGGARPQEIIALLDLEQESSIVRYHRTGLYAGAEPVADRPKGLWRRWSRSRTQTQGN